SLHRSINLIGANMNESQSGTSMEEALTKRKVTHTLTSGYSGNFFLIFLVIIVTIASDHVRVPNVIVMVGLPARGKTYISKKLCRYLNWAGIKTRVFNVGEYRRKEETASDAIHGANANFFSANNEDALRVREESARRAMQDLCDYLDSSNGTVAILDATNTTKKRRKMVVEFCQERRFRCFFIESVCDDPNIINANVTDVKVNSPDYKGVMSAEQAKDDFMKRIDNYKKQYEPLDMENEGDISFIKVLNAGRSFYVNQVNGHAQSRVIYYLMNIHLLPRVIYFSRHGESEYNRMGRMGGDSPLTPEGDEYARALVHFFKGERVQDLRVWCSQKIRAVQTAKGLKQVAAHVEYWKALDELDAGICEGLTYDDIANRYPKQTEDRMKDKYHYRFPSGESYEDVVARLEPVIMELERQGNVLVVSHQAVLRCILAYFTDRPLDEVPYIDVPLHTLIKLVPRAYSCHLIFYTYYVTRGIWTASEAPLTLSQSPTSSSPIN
ncbi:hypothetical protein PFISCL1PPCAC_15609, partial [Pristionchus fissidentatus]